MNLKKLKAESNSLTAKHLTDNALKKMQQSPTKLGYTIEQAIKSNIDNPDSNMGIYAGDVESYKAFEDIFNPVIEDYHKYKISDDHVFDRDASNLNIEFDDNLSKYIKSTRIRTARNLSQYSFGGNCTPEQRKLVETEIVNALNGLNGELDGNYYAITSMSSEQQQDLVDQHFLFKQGDRFLASAGLNADWPNNRGIYYNTDKTFLVWVNEEDQLRIISMQQGGDVLSVYARLVKAVNILETSLDFAKDKKLGYLTSCPTNIGTGIRASVHIKLEKLANDMPKLEELATKYNLQVRGQFGEHSESVEPIFDISNKRRLGLSEFDCVSDLYDGVKAIIALEENI